jgi:glucose-1-phosphate cytidylyltransferase
MKVGILAGGVGTRLQEETIVRPKPMIEIGGHPIIWHIMKIYAAQGHTEFVIALGHKGEVIKDFFVSYSHRTSSLTVRLQSGDVLVRDGGPEDWTVHLLDTGAQTQTGGRVKRLAEFIGDETFMLTYGDGVGNIDLARLLACHKRHGKLATVSAVRPPARFGGITIEDDSVMRFEEKPQIGEGWINGGFFVLEPAIAKYILGDETVFERDPLEQLAKEGQLAAYRHEGFWQCMDTLRDVRLLDDLWRQGNAPWKVWS